MQTRRQFIKTTAALGASFLLSSFSFSQSRKVQPSNNSVSYKLEDLCDTETDSFKDLTIHVYIKPSDRIWDFHQADYKKEFFKYIKDFFRTQNVNCRLIESNSALGSYCSRNEFGVELYDSAKSLAERYQSIFPDKDARKIDNPKEFFKKWEGDSLTEKGIVLFNVGWHEFRDYMSREEIEEAFSQISENRIRIGEEHIRANARWIMHEILHCVPLWHAGMFRPIQVPVYTGEIPNIMSYQPTNFTNIKKYPLGTCLTALQRKLLHSRLAGNNMHKAFENVNLDYNEFLVNFGRANKLGIIKKEGGIAYF